ncbi:hypothetical protein [Tissierella sp. Yu-01]|nr:hypothetical protein [Tissierella sp. Yu-01]WFA08730.1 hypothetical protein P3962_13535 [Tissierella sp. Yu-01]
MSNIDFSIGKFKNGKAEIRMEGIFKYAGNQYDIEAVIDNILLNYKILV